jgi:nucleotide-binding universal stress UspA family protein
MGQTPQLIAYALEQAKKENAELLTCFLIDAEIPGSVSSWMIYVGFMGDKPSDEYKDIVMGEYVKRANEDLKEVANMAKEQGVSQRSFLLKENPVDECLKIARGEGVDLIVASKPQGSRLSRFIFGSLITELIEKSPCPVKVVND